MVVRLNWSALKQSRWYEYIVRFGLGGLATAMAGLVAQSFGPETGGLFLAFPAIFGASATLIEKHERERKEKPGLPGRRRGTDAAALDAAGASLGSVGLAAFGLSIWLLAPGLHFVSLALGSVAWLLVSVSSWRLRRRVRIVRC
jgi:Protein of unknown function (DUF3147)